MTPIELLIIKFIGVFTIICLVGFWVLILMFFITVFNYVNKRK